MKPTRDLLPGVYAVVLTAVDNAGNHQTARRFLIFDNVNVVSINTAEDKVLVVNSAAENTSYTWLTSLQSSSNAGEKANNLVGRILAYNLCNILIKLYRFKTFWQFRSFSHEYIFYLAAFAIIATWNNIFPIQYSWMSSAKYRYNF